MMQAPRHQWLLLIWFLMPAWVFGQQETVTVAVTDGEQIRCATDSVVTVTVAPNPNRVMTEMRLFWSDDDNNPVIIRPGDSFEHTFSYALSRLFQECKYDCNFSNGFCETITVVANYEDGNPENNSLRLTFKIPPRPFFLGVSTCVGTPVVFGNQTCPDNDEDMTYSWTISGSEVATEVTPSLAFDNPGTFDLELAATNLCGTSTYRQSIDVTEPASAFALADSNITSVDGSVYVLCGTGRLGTRLLANGSTNATSFSWTGSNGVRFDDDRRNDTTRVSFNGAGTYTVTLEVDNVCERKSTTDITFEVIEAQSLSLQSIPDECLEIAYTPSPLVEDASYSINGQTYAASDFPVTLSAQTEAYVVEARLVNPCGEQVVRDSFFVLTPEAVRITNPTADTSVCENTQSFELSASQTGGKWELDGRSISDSFDPADYGPGMYTLQYEVGMGNCATQADVQIEIIPGPQVDLGPDEQFCMDDSPIILSASPMGGVWSGSGIIDPATGLFAPSVAGPGTVDLQYTVERAGDGCQGLGRKSVEVVGLPMLQLPDSALVCAGAGAINLDDLTNPQASPGGGAFSWSGIGISGTNFDPDGAGGIGVYTASLDYTIMPGCTTSDSILLRVDSRREARTPNDTTLCSDQGTFLLLGQPAGGQWLDDNSRTISENINLSNLDVGLNRFTYVISSGTSCESSASFQINIIDAAGLQAGADIYVCETETAIQLPAQSGVWLGPALLDERTIDLNQLGIGSHTFTVTDSTLPAACNSDDLTLFRTPLPEALLAADSTGCMDSPILFQNNSVGAERFRWDFGDGGESTQREPSHVYTDAGIYRIQLEVFTLNPVTNQQLCSAVTNSEIRIFQPPERVAFMPSITQGCSPLEVDFTNQSVGEQLGFEWVFGNGQLSSATNPTEIFFEAGLRDTTFAVRLAVGNGCGNAEAVDSIRVFAQPTARFATEIRSEYCSGEIVSIGHRSLADRLEWDFGNGITYTGEEPPDQQYFTGMDQNDTVTLQLLAYNQCGIDTATQSLVIVPTDARAAISVDSDQPCRGDTIYLESLSRPIDALVEWILPDGSRRNGNRIPVIFDQIGTQRIEMKVFSCGQDSASIDLVVQPTPELRLSAPAASCPGELIEVAMQTNAEPQWIIIDLDTFFQRTQATAILDSADLVLVEALAQNNAGCQTSISQFIDLQPSPVANIARIDSICMGSPAVLLSTSEGSSSCLWTLPDGSQRSGCSVMHSFDQSGPQTVGLRVRSQIGCSDSTVAPVFVRPTPVPVFDVVVLDTCTPARIQLIDQSTDADELAWWLPDGQVTYGDTVVFVQSVGGTFNVELRAGNEGICYATLRQEATVFGSPVLSLEKIESCTQDDGFTLVVNAEPEAFVTVTGPDYDAAGSLHTKLQPGGYFLSAETSNGCLTDTVTSIPPVNELFASISGLDSIRIKLGEVFPMEVNVNLSATQVMWSPDIYFSDPQMRLTSVQPLRSGNLVVQVQDERGCVVLDTVYVTVIIDREIGIFIPNAFTPNGDGTNDVFRVRSSNPALEMIEELRVFDPGGNQVFYLQEGLPNDETYGWDGTFQGREATAGGYIYMAILRYVDGEKIIRKGDLNLIR